jgi:co-chaperonin GroES (HSP10)
MKLRVHPGRVAVRNREVRLKSALHVPENRFKLYEIAEVVAVGSLEGLSEESYNRGDIVLYQVARPMKDRITFHVRGVPTSFLHVNDIIGRLSEDIVEYANFKIVGKYVLLDKQIRQPRGDLIILPLQFEPQTVEELTHYSVLQKGADVNGDYDVGQEVFPDRGAGNNITIDNRDLMFVDQAYICGALTAI